MSFDPDKYFLSLEGLSSASEVINTLDSVGWTVLRREVRKLEEKLLKDVLTGGASKHDYHVGKYDGVKAALIFIEQQQEIARRTLDESLDKKV